MINAIAMLIEASA